MKKMKVEDLKPGYIILTKHMLIADVYNDADNTLRVGIRHEDEIPRVIKNHQDYDACKEPASVKDIYKSNDIDETVISIKSKSLNGELYGIFMVFGYPKKHECHTADNIVDLFKSRELLFISDRYNSKLKEYLLSSLHDKDLIREIHHRGYDCFRS